MAARTKSKVTPKYKTKYRVKNWPAYEAALRKRGDVTLWFDEDALAAWNASPSGRSGGQRRYSDLAILTALTLRTVFHLPLRQTEGFVASLIRVMDLDLETPDHTTLSRRGSTVVVPALAKMHDEPILLVIDSTGLKIVGDGEWHARKHKTSNKRRSWRKLHLGVDGDGFIVASQLTESSVDDSSVGVTMIKEGGASIGRFTVDGAYRHDSDLPSTRDRRPTRGCHRGPAEEDGISLEVRGRCPPTARCRDREDRRGEQASVAEGVRCSSSSPRRERNVSVQANHRGPSPSQET
jgi:hypothetical protein